MKQLDGKALAKNITDALVPKVEAFYRTHNHKPTLAVIIVGDDPASHAYIKMKAKACEQVGMHSIIKHFQASIDQDTLLDCIQSINADKSINGLLVQLPLPMHLDAQAVINTIDPQKDVDGFTPSNVGRLWIGDTKQGFCPATPLGVMHLLDHYAITLTGKEAVVIGTSDIVGKPLAGLLLSRGATVSMCNSNTKDLKSHTLRADVLCVGVGKAQFITQDMVKDNAIVVDIGINKTSTGLVGDVDFQGLGQKASYITPVPGGVGPMTIAVLLQNTLKAGQLQNTPSKKENLAH